MFVTTFGMDNSECTKMNAYFQKLTACLWEVLIHECKHALLAPPFLLMSVNNSWLCSSYNQLFCVLMQCSTTEPSTQSTWPPSPCSRLGIQLQNLSPTQLIQSWSLWPFCCLYTQTIFHRQALVYTLLTTSALLAKTM